MEVKEEKKKNIIFYLSREKEKSRGDCKKRGRTRTISSSGKTQGEILLLRSDGGERSFRSRLEGSVERLLS